MESARSRGTSSIRFFAKTVKSSISSTSIMRSLQWTTSAKTVSHSSKKFQSRWKSSKRTFNSSFLSWSTSQAPYKNRTSCTNNFYRQIFESRSTWLRANCPYFWVCFTRLVMIWNSCILIWTSSKSASKLTQSSFLGSWQSKALMPGYWWRPSSISARLTSPLQKSFSSRSKSAFTYTKQGNISNLFASSKASPLWKKWKACATTSTVSKKTSST